MEIVSDYSTAWRSYLHSDSWFLRPSLSLKLVSCTDYLPTTGDRNLTLTRSSQTFIPLKYCLTLRSSCKYRMCAILRIGELMADTACQEQPLSASFEKLYQFVGWYDQWIDLHGNILRQRDQDAFHAVHSLIWSIAGLSICFRD